MVKKTCGSCAKTINLKKLKIDDKYTYFCDTHISIERRKQQRLKKAKIITIRKLDSVFSKVVRSFYKEYCHACKGNFKYERLQAAHLVSRRYMRWRYDLRNVFPACKQCNLYDQCHTIWLAETCENLYGKSLKDYLLKHRFDQMQFTKGLKEELYEFYSNFNYTIDNRKEAIEKYEQIIHKYKQW